MLVDTRPAQAHINLGWCICQLRIGTAAPWQRPKPRLASKPERERRAPLATNELTSVDSPSWPDKWWMPFLWVILTPIVTVPLSAILFGVLAGYHEPHEVGLPPNPPPCPRPFELFADPDPDCGPQFGYSEVSVTLLAFIVPGLLNLAPFLWVSSTRPRVRAAGIVAGLLGLLRLALPPTVLMLAQDRVSSDGGSYFEYVLGWFDGSPFIDVWFFGAAAWLGSLLVWWLFILLWGLFIWLWRDTEEGE